MNLTPESIVQFGALGVLMYVLRWLAGFLDRMGERVGAAFDRSANAVQGVQAAMAKHDTDDEKRFGDVRAAITAESANARAAVREELESAGVIPVPRQQTLPGNGASP